MKTDWTEKIRETLSESAVTPPEGIWEGIISGLDAAESPVPVRKKTKNWRWYAAAACIAAAAVGGVIFITSILSDEGLTPGTIAQVGTSAKDKDTYQTAGMANTHASAPQTKDAVHQSTSAHHPEQTYTKSHKERTSETSCIKDLATNGTSDINDLATNDGSGVKDIAANTATDNKERAENTATAATDIADKKPSVNKQASENSAAENKDSKPSNIQADTTQTRTNDLKEWWSMQTDIPLLASTSTQKRQISLGLYAGNSTLGAKSNDDTHGDLFASTDPYFGNTNYGVNAGVSEFQPSTYYKLKDAKHKQPIRIGLSARIPIYESFSISAGVNYSLLTSTLTWESETAKELENEQTLHYIGIPVSVDYKIPSHHATTFYLTVGAMAEKCVYGQTKDEKTANTQKISEKPLQLSLFAGAGVQIRLYDNISFYAEPLVDYYIDNHSPIYNIYKDRPLNLDLRIGLRYNIK